MYVVASVESEKREKKSADNFDWVPQTNHFETQLNSICSKTKSN